MSLRLPVSLLLIFVHLGCGPDAKEMAARAYVQTMTPLLKRNTTLSRTFLDVASKIKRDELTPGQVADRFGERIVPQAEDLRDAVIEVQSTTTRIDEIHLGLVRGWSNRATAYRSMHQAWVDGNLPVFNGAAQDQLTVHKAEKRYFDSMHKVLKPYGLDLPPYP